MVGETFNNFIIVCILIAGINVGLQTYPYYPKDECDTYDSKDWKQADFNPFPCAKKVHPLGSFEPSPAPTVYTDRADDMGWNGVDGYTRAIPLSIIIDVTVTFVFIIECTFKMLAEGFGTWRYWCGPEWKWNNFDFIIVAMCLPGVKVPGDPPVALLRLARLARIAKIIKKVPQLQMIVMGLVGGIKSIAYIAILLVLVFYLYAICGIMLFRKNDPWHWNNLPTAMITLFRCATLEDWTDVMYINIYGCDKFGGGIYSLSTFIGSYEPDAHDRAMFGCAIEGGAMPRTNMFFSPLFFITFIIISALVMLSLFVGAVTMSMTQSMEEMKVQQAEAQRRKHLAKGEKKLAEQSAKGDAGDDEPAAGSKADREQRKMRALMLQAWDGGDLSSHASADVDDVNERFKGDGALVAVKRAYARLASRALVIAEANWFQMSITGVIVVAGVTVGIGTDEALARSLGARDEGWNGGPLDVLDLCILYIFTAEILVKASAGREFRARSKSGRGGRGVECAAGMVGRERVRTHSRPLTHFSPRLSPRSSSPRNSSR